MRTKTYTLTGINVSTTGIAAAQAPTSGTPLTLQAAAAALSPNRFITLTDAVDLSAISFTIVGTDRWGNAMTEVVVGPNNATVSSKGAYASVTSITPNGTSASTVSAGWPVGAVTPWVLCGQSMGVNAPPTALVSLLATLGAPTGNAEATYTMFATLSEPSIDIDDRQAMLPGPSASSPMEARGRGVRFVMTSGTGTSAVFKVTRGGVKN